VTTTTPGLPPGLRDRVLAAARDARAAGRPVDDAPPIDPEEAYAGAADAFFALLGALDEAQWRAPVLRDLDVQGLVGHLVGVEVDVRRALSGEPEVGGADHVGSTQASALAESGRLPWLTVRSFREAVDRTLRALAADPDGGGRRLELHGMRLTRDELLVVRAFELWTHESDIRAVAGLPPRVPDPPTLRAMTDLAVSWLPFGVRRAAPGEPRLDLHLVLTGPGGGTWDLPVGRGDAAPAPVLLVLDAVDFCRLVADRVADDVVGQREGDEDATAAVLAGARALALD
jgi:uncharacterized protein (TIGR03083 family)